VLSGNPSPASTQVNIASRLIEYPQKAIFFGLQERQETVIKEKLLPTPNKKNNAPAQST